MMAKKIEMCFSLSKFQCVTLVQREYCRVSNEDPSHKTNVYRWYKRIKGTEAYTTESVLVRPPILQVTN